MSANKAFDQWVKSTPIVVHVKDCSQAKYLPNTPINECVCKCYERAIFRAGYFAARGVKNNETTKRDE